MSRLVGNDVLYPELSYKIMEIVFEIHNKLRPGFTEDIYGEATAIDLRSQGIPFERQKAIEVVYNGQVIGKYRIDLIVDSKIILELKAVSTLNDIFKQQILSYLKATNLSLGIFINFGTRRVESIRVVN